MSSTSYGREGSGTSFVPTMFSVFFVYPDHFVVQTKAIRGANLEVVFTHQVQEKNRMPRAAAPAESQKDDFSVHSSPLLSSSNVYSPSGAAGNVYSPTSNVYSSSAAPVYATGPPSTNGDGGKVPREPRRGSGDYPKHPEHAGAGSARATASEGLRTKRVPGDRIQRGSFGEMKPKEPRWMRNQGPPVVSAAGASPSSEKQEPSSSSSKHVPPVDLFGEVEVGLFQRGDVVLLKSLQGAVFCSLNGCVGLVHERQYLRVGEDAASGSGEHYLVSIRDEPPDQLQ